jgi:quercetin dioxygenase-like cupin family protein
LEVFGVGFIGAGEGETAVAGGNSVTFKIGPDAGAKDLSMFESLVPPGGRVFPHRHRRYEEAFYVLEGEMAFLLGDDWHSGGAGTAVHVPRGVVHAFHNRSSEATRLLVLHTPAAAIRMIEELAVLGHEGEPTEIAAVLARHDSEPARLAGAG